MSIKPKHQKVKVTKIDAKPLARYGKSRTLIPLRHYLATDSEGNSIGKLPGRKDWTTRNFVSANVIHNAVADNINVGWRLGPSDLVIDVDPRNGGLDSFARLPIDESKYVKVVSGREDGGFHLYMTKPVGMATRERLPSFPGVEFKKLGRQVVCAGSLHHSTGRHYKFDDNHPRIEDGIREAPKALLRLIQYTPNAGDDSCDGMMDRAAVEKLLGELDPAEVVPDNDAFEKFAPAAKKACADEDAESAVLEWLALDAGQDDPAGRWESYSNDRDGGLGVGTFISILLKHGVDREVIESVFGPSPNRVEAADDFDEDEDMDFETPAKLPSEYAEFDGDVSPQDSREVISRGLKVSKQDVASDTFKNALAAITSAGLQPAYNEMARQVEFRGDVPWDVAQHGRVLDDRVLAIVRLYLIGKYQGVDYDPGGKNLNEALDAIAYGNRFNPVAEYLDSLAWDGTPRLAKLFGEFFNCGEDSYTRGVSIAFGVGAVRRIRHPGCKFDTMPVLRSPQGWNKSTALRKLFGDQFYSDSSLGPLTHKDASMKLRGLWVCEFAEIESLRKHEVNVLKAFVSQLTDRQRDPYERRVGDVPRSNVFSATVNEGGYLGDMTGGRRFWPLELQKSIDVAKIEDQRDQLWAEAAALEAEGTSSVLPTNLWDTAAKRQQAETIDDPWTDTLRDYLEDRASPAALGGEDDDGFEPPPADKVHLDELFSALDVGTKDRTKIMSGRLRSAMESRLGWKYRHSIRVGGIVKTGFERVKDEK